MKKIKVSEDTFNRLERLASIKGKTIAEVVAQKVGTSEQYDKYTKDGVLRRTYYYQKSRYADVKTLAKFLKRWNKDEKFKEIWSDYEAMDFNTRYAPTFFRWGNDIDGEKLYVTTKGNVRSEKEALKIMNNKW